MPPTEADRFRDRSDAGGSFEDELEWFLQGLKIHESGGRYQAKSPHSSASGAYQYIDSTWDNYAGYSQAWMAPPEVQDERARRDYRAAYERLGDWRKVAVQHFYPAWVNKPEMWGQPPAPNNPTVNQFVSSVMSKMEQASNGQLDIPDVQAAASGGGVSQASMPTLRSGSSGSDVRALQQALKDAGHDPGPIDGIYGPRTAAAVRSYQEANGLTVDGIAGSQTYGSLGIGGGGGGAAGEEGIEAEIRKLYGYSAWALDHPEIGGILREAAEGGWSPQRLQGAISQTDWWKTTQRTAREWLALKGEDPAEAQRRVDRAATNIQAMASRAGVDISSDRLQKMAEDAEKFGWTELELQMAVGAEAQFEPGAVQRGDLGANVQFIREQASRYLVPVSDRWAFEKAQDMVQGVADQDNVIADLVGLARQRYPHLTDQINAGTLGDLAAGMRQEAARLLEIDPTEIDLVEDPKFSRLLATRDGNETRPMSIPEVQDYVRGLDEWRYTDQANAKGAQMSQMLLQTFGEIR